METSHPLGQIFRFGPFELNLRTGELRKRGMRIYVQEQPLRILMALLEAPGEIVGREDLCGRLWPQGTFVDFEHSLNAAVRRLRITLGDEAETPRFIETVHRRGYRFLVWGDLTGRPLPVKTAPVAAVRSAAVVEAPFRTAVRATPARARLAVLPFVSFDGDERANWFNDGLTEETVTQMARLCPSHIGVIARTSVARLMAGPRSPIETGRIFEADFLLEGSVRREGDRFRIVAQLIESSDETHLWAATYDRIVVDTLSVQTEVADEIARAVSARLNALRQPLSREAAS